MEDAIWAIAIAVVLCTGMRSCMEYNVASEQALAAAKSEALKGGRSANEVACAFNGNIAACERAAKELKP